MNRLTFNFLTSQLFLALLVTFVCANSLPCIPKSFGRSSIVCVCNDTYCDTQEPLSSVEIGQGQLYHVVSTQNGKRFESNIFSVADLRSRARTKAIDGVVPMAQLVINRNIQYQEMIGFGGAFTDAGGRNLLDMTLNLRESIMNSYFSEDGLEYTVQRVPIGGTDFSERSYTLCDEEGPEGEKLQNFALQDYEDLELKIPFINWARELQPNLKLFASPWSAPIWMKTNGLISGGLLKTEYYQTWADYFVKFFEEYQANNVTFWGLTPQNEPEHGVVIGGQWNSMGWLPRAQRDFIKNNLGPALNESGFGDLKLMVNDGQRFQLLPFSRPILNDPEAAKYVSGVALHWYSNFFYPPTVLNTMHTEYPQYFMINTEACTGYLHFLGIDPVALGSWERAEYYAHNIIEDLNHWLAGWVEWNLVLDTEGGPNWFGNNVDSPVIFNKTANEAYKQPMYYALGHFSKYIPEGSVRIFNSGEMNLNGLQILSVLRPDGQVVAVVFNPRNEAVLLDIHDTFYPRNVRVEIEPKSINTLVYSNLTIEAGDDEPNGAAYSVLSKSILVTAFCLMYLMYVVMF